MPFTTKIVAEIEGKRAKLAQWLEYQGKDDKIQVPPGFWTDFASVPQFVTWLIPTMGAYSGAAILHDKLCEDLNEYRKTWEAPFAPIARGLGSEQRYKLLTIAAMAKPPQVNARDTDGIFRRIMRELGVPPVRRWLIWCGVRWGALANPARREGWLRDAPKVGLISLLALPVVLPASVFVGLGLLIMWLIEEIVGWF